MAESYRAGEVAERLGVPPSTLRLYSVRFAAWLSPGAASPGAAGGRKGHRSYTDGDIALLARIKELLGRGRTVAESQSALGPPRQADAARLAAEFREQRPLPARQVETPRPTLERQVSEVAAEAAHIAPAAATRAPSVDTAEQVVAVLLHALAEAQESATVWRRLLERRRHEAEFLRVEALRQEVELARLAVRLGERMRGVLRRVEQLVEPVRGLALDRGEEQDRVRSRRR